MTKQEKEFMLDVLDDYYNIISLFNKGLTLHSSKKAGGFDDDLKKIEKLTKSFKDLPIKD